MLNKPGLVSMVAAALVGVFGGASAPAQPAPPLPRVAAMGDSLTDEYAEQTYGAYARSWTQILVQAGRIDMGPTAAQAGVPFGDWGEPRRTGYKLNWARYSETTDWAIASGQPAGAASSAAAGDAEYVIIWLGGNDFAPWAYGTYNDIYYNRWTAAQTEAFVAQRLANLRSMVQLIRASGGRIVLCSISDFAFMPWVWGLHESVLDRERVSLVMANLRDRTRALANEFGLVFMDMFRFNKDLFGPNFDQRSSVLVGNVPIAMQSWAMRADSAFLDDGTHPRTIIQAVWSAAMLTALKAGYAVQAPDFTERDMVEAAGLTYGGADTLGLVMPPFRRYVQNFRCPADFDVDGQVGVQDIFDFLSAYFVSDTRADLDANASVGLADLFAFLTRYFVGCP